MNTFSTVRRPFLLITFVLALLISACAPHQFTGMVLQEDTLAADIVGTDYTGESYRLSDHRGKLSLIFFGYTFCPDVCPLTLANMSQMYKILEDESPKLVEDLNMVFVSSTRLSTGFTSLQKRWNRSSRPTASTPRKIHRSPERQPPSI